MKIALVISTAVAVVSAIDQHPTLLKNEARLSRRGITIEGTGNRIGSVITDKEGVVQEANNVSVDNEGILDGNGNPIDPATLSRGDLKQGGTIHAPMTKEEEQALKKEMGEMADSMKSNTDSSSLDRLLESVLKNEPLAKDQAGESGSVKQPPSTKPEPKEVAKPEPKEVLKEAPKEVAKEAPRETPKQESSGSSGLFLKSEIEGSIHASINPSTSNSSVTPGRFSRPVASANPAPAPAPVPAPASVSASEPANAQIAKNPASNVVTYTGAGALGANQGVAVICAAVASMLLLCF